MGAYKLSRICSRSGGWGLEIRWGNATVSWLLGVHGCQVVGPWSFYRLEAWRSQPNRLIVFVSGIKKSSFMHDSAVGQRHVYPDPVAVPGEFWAICREARKTKTPEPVVDWLHEFGPPCVARLLDQGIPDGDGVFPPD